MTSTVPTTAAPSIPAMFRPSGALLPGIPQQPTAESASQRREASDRTITYTLLGGGSLTATCPAWCTDSHESDLRGAGLHPSDLQHRSDHLTLDLTTFGGEKVGILNAYIAQDPFSDKGEAARPNVVFCPIEGDEPLEQEHLSARQLGEVIDQLQEHVDRLRVMQEQLAQAAADEHAAYHRWLDAHGSRSQTGMWESLRLEDVKSLPLPYLLAQFGGSVVEGDGAARLQGKPGELTIHIARTLPQGEREGVVRELLVQLAAKVLKK